MTQERTDETWWRSIGRALGNRIPGAADRQAERERREREDQALLVKGRLLHELQEHPGWAVYLAEVQAAILGTEETILALLPMPSLHSPHPYYELAQEHAMRGQIRGYRAALSLVDQIIAQATELARSRAEQGEGTG